MMDSNTTASGGADPGAASSAGLPRTVLIGAGVVLAITLVLLAVFLLRPEDNAIAEASATPPATAEASVAPTSATPSATAEASVAPAASASAAIPDAWVAVATFSEAGKRYVLGDLVAWADGLVAVGTLYEEENRGVFGPPPPRSGRVWRSTDGTNWTDATPSGTFADVELLHLFETSDGALVAVGHRYPELEAVSVAWETQDGETWTPADLIGFPFGSFVRDLASGGQGHLADAYFSADGRNWQQTLEGVDSLAAGDEGFVVSTTSEAGGTTNTQWQASGDGIVWIVATKPADGAFLAAPRGPDWLATTTSFADDGSISAATWGSANGLDWSALGTLALQSVDVGGGVTCAEAPAALHPLPEITIAATTLASGCSEGAVVTAGGSYASIDGIEWARLPFGDHAYAAGAEEIGDRIVIATDARTNQADVIGVTFWISD